MLAQIYGKEYGGITLPYNKNRDWHLLTCFKE